MTDPTVAQTFRDLDLRDRRHGLTKIGYHFVIERDGKVKSGRALNEASMHDHLRLAKEAVSVCLIGGVDETGNPTNNFTDAQYDAFVHLAPTLKQAGIKTVKAVTPAITNHEVSCWFGQ